MDAPVGGDGRGLVLVRGRQGASARWLRRGLVAVAVVELPGWTGVCLAEREARSQAPYDVGLEVLAARPVPGRRRPSIGLFVVDGCAVVTVQPRGWRADQRWLVWEPGSGVRRAADLPPLPAALIVAAAGAGQRTTAGAVQELLRDVSGEPIDLLVALLRELGLPGEQLLRDGPGVHAVEVHPSARSVAAFDRLVHERDEHARLDGRAEHADGDERGGQADDHPTDTSPQEERG